MKRDIKNFLIVQTSSVSDLFFLYIIYDPSLNTPKSIQRICWQIVLDLLISVMYNGIALRGGIWIYEGSQSDRLVDTAGIVLCHSSGFFFGSCCLAESKPRLGKLGNLGWTHHRTFFCDQQLPQQPADYGENIRLEQKGRPSSRFL